MSCVNYNIESNQYVALDNSGNKSKLFDDLLSKGHSINDTLTLFSITNLPSFKGKLEEPSYEELISYAKAVPQGQLIGFRNKYEEMPVYIGNNSELSYLQKVKSEFPALAPYITSKVVTREGTRKAYFSTNFPSNDFFQTVSKTDEKANKELDQKVTNFLSLLGVKVETLEQSRYKNKGVIAVADMLSKIAYVSNNKATIDTLPEEASHFLVEFLKQQKSPLYNSMILDIEKYDEYQEVIEEYGSLPEYQDNLTKLREEAIGKVIAKRIVEGFKNDTYQEKRLTTWFDKVLDFFNSIIKQAGFTSDKKVEDYFQLAANTILNSDVNQEIKSTDNVFNQALAQNQVNYTLKVVDKINSNISKINQWYKQLGNTNTFWNKIQNDLQIPKEQVELFKNSKGNTIDEKLIDFSSNYSYNVEIDIAKEKTKLQKIINNNIFTFQSDNYYYAKVGNFYSKYKIVDKNTPNAKFDEDKNVYYLSGENNSISYDEYEKALEESNTVKTPTQYYSNLTVAGGTNYTENEISTPLITPSIKGHAQFATDKGIGWFRSDEQISGYGIEQGEKSSLFPLGLSKQTIKTDTKTRRILEVQSDLFQKGRLKEDLILSQNEDNVYNAKKEDSTREEFWIAKEKGKQISLYNNTFYEYNGYYYDFLSFSDKYYKIEKNSKIDTSENQFLQLLNKDNNWVTFFVKSIIQDTAKQTITEVQESDVEAKVRELEREGLLEIDCKGKLKAEKGLQTNFTKGGKWKLVKDLKGYPTHKEGGVDLTIGKNGVSIRNGDTEFTAKHGLVIPKN